MEMRIEIPEALSIEEFSVANGLILVVHKRSPKDIQRFNVPQYWAEFENVEVSTGGGKFLCSTMGQGETIAEAMRDYANRISEERLVVNARTDARREIDAPIIYVSGEG